MKPERITEGDKIEAWRQHLLDAAAYMEEHGHCKDKLRDDDNGSVCVVGALVFGPFGGDMFFSASRAGRVVINALQQYSEKHNGIDAVTFNNRPETTKEMAVSALIGAALS